MLLSLEEDTERRRSTGHRTSGIPVRKYDLISRFMDSADRIHKAYSISMIESKSYD